MFKPVAPHRSQRKTLIVGKTQIATEQAGTGGQFRTNAIEVSSLDRIRTSCQAVTKIAGIPRPGEQFRIITHKQLNSFDFVLAVLDKEKILKLHINIFRIGKRVTAELARLKEQGKIQHVVILINDGFPQLVPDVYKQLTAQEGPKWEIKLVHTHAKVILMETDQGNYYTVEGSGNLSVNARIEQYVFDNIQKVHQFHKDWMEKI